MKTPLFIFVLLATLTGSAITFLEWQRHHRQDQQLLAYEQHVQQLLGEVENTSLRRIDTEKQLEQVRAALAEIRRQMTAVSSLLQVAQEKVNPEYEAMEQRIRREVRSELQAQRPATPILTNSKTDLLRQISQLDPNEARELMTLQSMYGGFLQLLDVDDARLEVIVDGLSSMIAEQNQTRMDLLQQMQQDPTIANNPQQLRRQLRTISNPESQTDALSFILTDAELALFSQYQASQPQRTFSRTMTIDTAGSGTAEAGVFIGSPPNGGPGILNFEIITAEPN